MPVRLRPRLQAAADMLPAGVIADIGCDHGRLAVYLAQSGKAARVIATDISAPALHKAQKLAAHTGTQDKITFLVSDGLTAIAPGAAQGLALCGMGGELILRILAACGQKLNGARVAVFQPMRGVEELRRFLFDGGYAIVADRVVSDAGRYYQVFSVSPGAQDAPPAWWPDDFFALGFKAAGDENFLPLAALMLRQCEKRLLSARGTRGEGELAQKRGALLRVIEALPAR